MPRQRKSLPSSFTTRARNTRIAYIEGVMNGTIEMPAKGTPEANSLAALASRARWGKAPKDMKKRSVIFGIGYKNDRSQGHYG
jgi:hypothetical protein